MLDHGRIFEALARVLYIQMDSLSSKDIKSFRELSLSGPQSLENAFSKVDYSPSMSSQSHEGYLKQSTVVLHDACESGDIEAVQRILSSGKADVNALIDGHRAYRTALHKASAYGHTDVVNLLLKAGASADKPSSVQRTALHEACMGGHKGTVMELAQYVKDLDTTDNHGQTAAHIAAYHGEAECLNVLIDNGCNLNCEENQKCTPAHLAVMKNHPETLRCLLDNNIDILQADGQGRTAVHYAALYGSTSCLKVFKQFHVDFKITDHSGGNASHHASAGGHLDCLKFLTKIGIPLDSKDKSGRTSAHYAAQKGSTECLHWLLEQGLDASITDDSGNTPAHCASSGDMKAMNCLLHHNSNMLLTNNLGDTPEMLSRKYGHTMAYQKAVNGSIKCPYCVKQQAQQEYDLKHQPSEVEKNIRLEEKVIFKSPVKTRSTVKPKSVTKPAHASHSKRNLSAQYYGDNLFQLTSEQEFTYSGQRNSNVK